MFYESPVTAQIHTQYDINESSNTSAYVAAAVPYIEAHVEPVPSHTTNTTNDTNDTHDATALPNMSNPNLTTNDAMGRSSSNPDITGFISYSLDISSTHGNISSNNSSSIRNSSSSSNGSNSSNDNNLVENEPSTSTTSITSTTSSTTATTVTSTTTTNTTTATNIYENTSTSI